MKRTAIRPVRPDWTALITIGLTMLWHSPPNLAAVGESAQSNGPCCAPRVASTEGVDDRQVVSNRRNLRRTEARIERRIDLVPQIEAKG
jgi:hypothetical protein